MSSFVAFISIPCEWRRAYMPIRVWRWKNNPRESVLIRYLVRSGLNCPRPEHKRSTTASLVAIFVGFLIKKRCYAYIHFILCIINIPPAHFYFFFWDKIFCVAPTVLEFRDPPASVSRMPPWPASSTFFTLQYLCHENVIFFPFW